MPVDEVNSAFCILHSAFCILNFELCILPSDEQWSRCGSVTFEGKQLTVVF